jgi:predicted DNA-binding transcriptional regulator AlpA
MNSQNQTIPTIVSMTDMAQLLNMSRSRFYQLINEGILLPPVYSLSNRRPFYTSEMAQRNIEAKRNNTGIHGQVILFYSTRAEVAQKTYKTKPAKVVEAKGKKQTANDKYTDLIDWLACLGLEDVTPSQIRSAVAFCFPDGTENVAEEKILTSVFRHLKRRNTADNVRR